MYGHAAELFKRCARGCDRPALCVSDKDGALICVVCAVEEEKKNAS